MVLEYARLWINDYEARILDFQGHMGLSNQFYKCLVKGQKYNPGMNRAGPGRAGYCTQPGRVMRTGPGTIRNRAGPVRVRDTNRAG